MHSLAQVSVTGKGRHSAAIQVPRDPDSCLGSVTSFLGGPEEVPRGRNNRIGEGQHTTLAECMTQTPEDPIQNMKAGLDPETHARGLNRGS